MTLVFEVLGVICAAALIRAISARSQSGSLRGWLASVAVGFGAFIAIALAMALTAIFERRRRSLATFYLVAGVGYLIGLVWSFWTSILPESFLEQTSAPRVVLPLGLLCVAAVLHLSAPES